jgi:hypothetical protein
MTSTTGGNYHCAQCGHAMNDLVFRPQSCDVLLPQEFCKACFKRSVAVPSDGITDDRLMMSAAYDICKGCGEYKPMVVGVEKTQEVRSKFQDIKDELRETVRSYSAVMQPSNMQAMVKAICDICDQLSNISR